MNVELLRQVQEKIKAEPKLFQMPALFKETDCGTACCFFGWGLIIKQIATDITEFVDVVEVNKTITYSSLFEVAQQQGESLVFSGQWPEPFRSQFAAAEEAGDKITQAEIACRRVDHFIETGE